ncbi:MAG: glycosyltransferase [Phycisphaerales bacterium]|nr:glycosyltransferase [Phycisphaerales bacterium]
MPSSQMHVLLFTDTLFDVNGVSRFIRNIAEQSLATGRELTVVTSTRLPCPPGCDAPNLINIPPHYARPMPGYPQLEIVYPSFSRLLALARHLEPDAIHVSTPGPVGSAGRKIARRLSHSLDHPIPLLGTYHTDFPAYIDHLFCEPAFTWTCTQAMQRFYRPFTRIFTRSDDYAAALVALGINRDRIVRLLPGIATDTFHTRHRPADARAFWSRYTHLGIEPDAPKALFVGRVSVEKNLPFLVKAWKAAAAVQFKPTPTSPAPAPLPQLVIIGDGPYRSRMAEELAGAHGGGGRAVFLGFKHGPELSALYAAADFFLFPSTTDTLGQVVMEAQSAGLPVVVTNVGGPSEVVRSALAPNLNGHDPTGYVLPATDVSAWARTISLLASDAALRARLGAAGHRMIQPMSIRHSFEHFWSVHEEALGSVGATTRESPSAVV